MDEQDRALQDSQNDVGDGSVPPDSRQPETSGKEEFPEHTEPNETADVPELSDPSESAVPCPASAPDQPKADIIGSLLEYVEIFAFSVAAVLVVFTMLFRLCRVDGSSMRKTLEDGQMLITTSVGKPEPGDIIVFSMTTERPEYDKLNEALVKRIIAKGGQTVRIDCNTGSVYVDGQLLEETYTVFLDGNGQDIGTVQQFPMYDYDRKTRIFETTVPEGYLFVMGDNRNHSTDSRTTIVGMVDERRVLGRVVLRLSPFTTDFD